MWSPLFKLKRNVGEAEQPEAGGPDRSTGEQRRSRQEQARAEAEQS
jgi:hypothetical protein